MLDEIAIRASVGGWRRAATCGAMFGYCVVLFVLLDFAYSSLAGDNQDPPSARIAHPIYDHGFAPKLETEELWGYLRYPIITNSLGFRDASTRDVPAKPSSRRILLIGDSFVEAMGVTYEDSFAGRLQRAGQARADKIEFLNAGVASYSPVIYYKKIKYLLESGLQFDEVLLFSDSSDVADEATTYFCIDDDPKYRAHCTAAEGSRHVGVPRTAAKRQYEFLTEHFVVTNYVRRAFLYLLRDDWRAFPLKGSRIAWALSGGGAGDDYKPLGVEGGIQRSLQNMGALADLLAARNIPLTIVVYPWARQIMDGSRDSRQVALWQDFCERRHCKAFVNLFPAFFAAAGADKDWYEHLYNVGDNHFSAAGNEMMFREIAKRLR